MTAEQFAIPSQIHIPWSVDGVLLYILLLPAIEASKTSVRRKAIITFQLSKCIIQRRVKAAEFGVTFENVLFILNHLREIETFKKYDIFKTCSRHYAIKHGFLFLSSILFPQSGFLFLFSGDGHNWSCVSLELSSRNDAFLNHFRVLLPFSATFTSLRTWHKLSNWKKRF